MIRLVALDMDGTLLNNEHLISERNKQAIQKAVAKGVKIVLLSGRNSVGMRKYVDELGIKDLTASMNGAQILDNNKQEALYDLRIEKDAASEIIKYVESIGIHMNYYHDEAIACSIETDYSKDYTRATSAPITSVGSLYEYNKNRQPSKMLLIGERKLLNTAREWIEKNHCNSVNHFFSNSNYLEITHKNVSKGEALKLIAKHYNLSMDQVMAIGDGENDISMIKAAGTGVAMGNASEQVKEEADFITLSNDEDGVAHALEQLVLL